MSVLLANLSNESNTNEITTITRFYDELFNYCFLVDYRMQLRRTLAHCHQNEKSVAEYTHELTELFNMIGDIPEHDQVLKFWNGSRPIIQKGLWWDTLNPETLSWARVVSQAEIIEISENIAERRDHKAGPSSQSAGASNPSSGGFHHPKVIMGGVQYSQYHMTIILLLIPRLVAVCIIATTATKITEPLILKVGKAHILLEEDLPLGEGLKHPGHSLPTMEAFLDYLKRRRQNE